MAAKSPPPNVAPSAVPPTSTPTPSPPHSSSPPPTTFSPTANPPDPTAPSTPSPPIAPLPSQNSAPPPLNSIPSPPFPQQTISPTSPLPPPPRSNSTPPAINPPMSSTPPPSNSPPPSTPVSSSPPSSPSPPSSAVTNPPPSSPPPVRNPPTSSTPPPSNPPPSSPPLQSPPPPPPSSPTPNSPPSPPSDPATSSPPPPPRSSSPPPVPNSPTSSPPPPLPVPNPTRSSPPPPSNPPTSSPPPQLPPSSSPPPNRTSSPPSDPTTGSPPPTQPSSSPPSPPLLNSPAPPAESGSSSKSSPNWSPPPPMRPLSPPPGVPAPSSDNRPELGSNSPSNKCCLQTVGVVAIAVAAGIVALILIVLVVWCLRRRRKENSGFNGVYVMPTPMGSSPRSDSSYIKTQSSAPLIGSGSGSDFVNSPKESSGLSNSRSLFTYEELIKATNGFSVQNLLGEGGFGSVYKGYLPDGREVAIKQLKIGGGQGEREFKAEVAIISRIHHRHLVSLVGYCISENQRLLIYDYVPNNTLYFHLHGEGQPALDWATRVKIAVGAARGIAYLHEDCDPRIIHRDIKSSNILLDNNFEARVSDFGLAKLALDVNTHVTTRVMGTFGYMAPEYASSGKLTEKSDVFSFGVVLLELITGRKPVDTSQPLGDESLVEWSRPLLSHALDNEEFDGLTDPRLGKSFVESEMFRMIEAAAACVRHSASKRPGMGQVVRALVSLATSDLTNGMRVGESEVYNSAQQSSEIRWFQRMAFGSQNYSTDFFSQGSLDS